MRHPLSALLAVGLAAVVAGARSFVAIGEWVSHQDVDALAGLGVTGSAPGEPTFRRAFARIEADAPRPHGGRLPVDPDNHGRATSGDRDRRENRLPSPQQGQGAHLVAAFDHHAGSVLGQVAVAAKCNEIPAVQGLRSCYRLLVRTLPRYELATPDRIWRHFLDTAGSVTVADTWPTSTCASTLSLTPIRTIRSAPPGAILAQYRRNTGSDHCSRRLEGTQPAFIFDQDRRRDPRQDQPHVNGLGDALLEVSG